MKEFILANWYYIILAVLAILGFIVSLILAIKKGKGSNSNIIESIKVALLEQIPFWAVLSEGLISGEDKKNNVLSLGIAVVRKMLGRDLTADENTFFVAFISDSLEKVLSAPQKKLTKAENAKKSKYTV